MKTPCFLLAAATGASLAAAETDPLNKLDRATLETRLNEDARAVLSHRDGLQSVIAFIETLPDLFPFETPQAPRLLRREEKEVAWNTWQRFLDYMLALDSIEQYHAGFARLVGDFQQDAFLVKDAAMHAKYRAALEFLDRADHNPELDKVLNDPVPEIGLPAGTYSKLKFKYLNVTIATSFAAHAVVLETFSGNRRADLRQAIRTDADFIWKTGRGRGQLLTAKNALKVVQDGAQSAWLPVQTGVSEWMGHTKVHRAGRSLISPAQIQELQPKLLPGDVLLERREWFLSNIGLPGFWSHAALYLGTAEERQAFFSDPAVREWVREQGEPGGDFEALLQAQYPDNYEQSRTPREDNHAVRVIEALGEGVSFTSLEHSAACDSLVVLRPRLPRTEKAQALRRAFHYAGRPYDYNFDFSTDAQLVCTELVYKSYEPAAGMTGLKFPLVEMLGRKVTPANELAKQFDAQYGSPQQQLDLVAFLDGRERDGRAVESSLAEFRQSWKRPKWHVLVQGESPP
jgi:hypothetical protein